MNMTVIRFGVLGTFGLIGIVLSIICIVKDLHKMHQDKIQKIRNILVPIGYMISICISVLTSNSMILFGNVIFVGLITWLMIMNQRHEIRLSHHKYNALKILNKSVSCYPMVALEAKRAISHKDLKDFSGVEILDIVNKGLDKEQAHLSDVSQRLSSEIHSLIKLERTN